MATIAAAENNSFFIERSTVDDSFWEELESAKKMPGVQRMTESLRLFDEVTRRMFAGIKAQFPGICDEEAHRTLSERSDIIRRIESLP